MKFTPPNFLKSVLQFLFIFALSLQTQANVLGDFQTFVPNTDGLFFITVDSGQTLKQNTIVGNIYLSYAKNYLLVYDNLTNQKNLNYKDTVTSLDGTVGYSVSDNLQLFLGVTELLNQSSDSNQATNYKLTSGVHSYRPGLKWKFDQTKDSQMALVTSVDLLNVKNDPYTGENPPNIYNIGYAWSGRFGGSATHGFNIGYRYRKPGSITADSTFYPLKSQVTFSYGYSYPWTPKTRLVFETIGCLPADKGGNKSTIETSCLEILGAARYRLNNTWAFVGGATIEPGVKTLAPDYRVFAGLNVYLYPNFNSPTKSDKNNIDPLVVPETASLLPQAIYDIPIQGGKKPYSCKITEGAPSSQLNGCQFVAPAFSDIARVEVSDDSGQTKTIEITTNAPSDTTAIPELILKPSTAKIYTGTSQVFLAEGGAPPYTYKIISGAGTVNDKTGQYKAPLNPTTATVQVTDARKSQTTSTVESVNPPKPNQTITLKGVNFIFNTTNLVKASQVKMEKAIAVLSKMKIREIIVGGHTDNIGSDIYNQDLSERRALTIAAILVERLGLRADQVKAVGYGFTKPLVENLDEESRLTNRRVELAIYTN